MSFSPRAHTRVWSWLLVGFLVVANLSVYFVYLTLGDVDRTFAETVRQDTEVVPDLDPRPVDVAPITFLVIGSDSREGLADLNHFGAFDGQRADVIMLIKIAPEDGTAQILSIPRDLWVDIPGHGQNRINAAFNIGGASLMVQTVRSVTGLPIHHFASVDFVGFQAIVDEIGGVVIDFPNPARDLKSGLAVEAGPRELDGQQALAYARSRAYQEKQGDSWTSVDANDVGRTHRQQRLVLAILAALKRPSTLTEAGHLVGTFASHLTIDAALAQTSVVQLAFRMRGISGGEIEMATLPGVDANVDGAAVLRLQQPEADQMLAAFASGATLDPSALQVMTLEVLNGNGVKGAATRWSDLLREKGFEVTSIGDADREDFETTLVIVRPDFLDGGASIVEALGFGQVTTGEVGSAFDAVVIVGADATRSADNG
jgi:LCP family protein required for cell wall assembly